jgi:hypothetical protein
MTPAKMKPTTHHNKNTNPKFLYDAYKKEVTNPA